MGRRPLQASYKKRRNDFYLDHVRDYRNTCWSHDEKKFILDLRLKKKLGAKEIQKELYRVFKKDVGIVSIYNQIRINKSLQRGLCYNCRVPLSKREVYYNKKHARNVKICFSCLKGTSEYKKSLRIKKLTNGLCSSCGKNPRESGHTYCRSCISYTYRHRIKRGLCGWCGKDPIDESRSYSLCTSCSDLNIEAHSKRRAKVKSNR